MEQMYKTSAEGMRQLIEIAICCGRCWQSPQTGYIHYCYTQQDENVQHTIPVYENFLFALALLRSRTVENVSDAKDLLRRLLHFQSAEAEAGGNFPLYLHDYPFCKDRLIGVHVLVPLYWIFKNFHHVLGPELKQSLKAALLRLQNYCLTSLEQKPAPYPIAMKAAAVAKAIGHLLDQPDLALKGERLFQQIQKSFDKSCWYSPAALSDLILAYQVLAPSFEKDLDTPFWQHLIATWHAPTASYCGPAWKEYQRGVKPQVTLYDFFMGYVSGTYSYRCFSDHPVQLQAALVHPTEDRLTKLDYPFKQEGMINGLPWEVVQNQEYACSLLAKQTAVVDVQEKTFAALKVLWGTPKRQHSFVCQGSTCPEINFSAEEKLVELTFSFTEPAAVDKEDKNQEISFYLDEDSENQICVEGTAATTFKMGEEVQISSGGMRLGLTFKLELGVGDFFGHIMKSSRPSQASSTGASRFAAYDRQIFLRTVSRSDDCVVKAILRFL